MMLHMCPALAYHLNRLWSRIVVAFDAVFSAVAPLKSHLGNNTRFGAATVNGPDYDETILPDERCWDHHQRAMNKEAAGKVIQVIEDASHWCAWLGKDGQ